MNYCVPFPSKCGTWRSNRCLVCRCSPCVCLLSAHALTADHVTHSSHLLSFLSTPPPLSLSSLSLSLHINIDIDQCRIISKFIPSPSVDLPMLSRDLFVSLTSTTTFRDSCCRINLSSFLGAEFSFSSLLPLYTSFLCVQGRGFGPVTNVKGADTSSKLSSPGVFGKLTDCVP